MAEPGTPTTDRPRVCNRCRAPVGADDACRVCGAPRPGGGWPVDPRLGQSLPGGLIVRERIGFGASGSIYVAADPTTGRRVAAKFLHPELAKDPEIVRRFRQEAVLMKSLGIPQVVRAYDWGTNADGDHYLTMELVSGWNLDQVLERRGALRVDDAVEVGRQVLLALAVSHSRCVVHRDLKPGNLILATDGQGRRLVKILDFGFAKMVPGETPGSANPVRLTKGLTVLGTPNYMSPEQAEAGARVDGRSDLYSLGALLYRTLTAVPPFEGETVEDVLRQHKDLAPEPPSRHRPAIPATLDGFVLRLLAKRPEDRFLSAEVALGELDRLFPRRDATWSVEDLSSRVIRTSALVEQVRSEVVDVPVKPRRLAPWILAGAGGVLVLAAAVLFVAKGC